MWNFVENLSSIQLVFNMSTITVDNALFVFFRSN